MVLLSVTNSVNMSVFERQGEFGTMQALGNRSRDVALLIVVESAILGFAGAVLGVVLGVGLAELISFIGIPMPRPPTRTWATPLTSRWCRAPWPARPWWASLARCWLESCRR